MRRRIISTVILASLAFTGKLYAQPSGDGTNIDSPAKTEIAISRLDCGKVQVNRGLMFSDSYDYAGQSFPLVESCYLVRHGDDYLLWDTGFSVDELGKKLVNGPPLSHSLDVTIEEQLKLADLAPEHISYVGISHYHPDHSGQAQFFPNATLLIGAQDWELLSGSNPPQIAAPDHFKNWISGRGTAKPVARDLDVFGDGSVTILATPGHTPGHRSLLIRLTEDRAVILTGDAAHLHENYSENRVPAFNTDRADTLASLDRLKQVERALNAIVVVQHEPKDVSKLRAFPEWSR